MSSATTASAAVTAPVALPSLDPATDPRPALHLVGDLHPVPSATHADTRARHVCHHPPTIRECRRYALIDALCIAATLAALITFSRLLMAWAASGLTPTFWFTLGTVATLGIAGPPIWRAEALPRVQNRRAQARCARTHPDTPPPPMETLR